MATGHFNSRDKHFPETCNEFIDAFPDETKVILKKTCEAFLNMSQEDAVKYDSLKRSFDDVATPEGFETKKWEIIYALLRLKIHQEEFLTGKEEITQRYNPQTAEMMVQTWSQFRNREILMSYIDFLCDKKSLEIGYHYFEFYNGYTGEMDCYARPSLCTFIETEPEEIYSLRDLIVEVITERIEFQRIRMENKNKMIINRKSYRKSILNRGM
jgi:hypothetical protein